VLTVGLAVGGGISTWCHSQGLVDRQLQHNLRLEGQRARRDEPAFSRLNLEPAHKKRFRAGMESPSTHVARGNGSDAIGSLGGRFAFVTLAYDPPGRSDHLWGVLALARAVQRLSSYPLVVLTNTTRFPDGTPVTEGFHKLNARVLPVHKVTRPSGRRFHFRAWNVAFWKLQIWQLTEYEKLVWLDADAILYRNMDWLFQREGMWAQRDDWFCKLNQPKVCSGIMLLRPNTSDFDGLMRLDAEHPAWASGDQQLISTYFSRIRGDPIHLLSDLEASFGQCLGRAPTPYRNKDGTAVRGSWSTPSFVHKSGGWGDTDNNAYNNVCFSHRMARQVYVKDGRAINVCHFHPLGAYWRSLFCEATELLGVKLLEVAAFCSDSCWYRGIGPACTALNGTDAGDSKGARGSGRPVSEVRFRK
jgi:hypothetical protein